MASMGHVFESLWSGVYVGVYVGEHATEFGFLPSLVGEEHTGIHHPID